MIWLYALMIVLSGLSAGLGLHSGNLLLLIFGALGLVGFAMILFERLSKTIRPDKRPPSEPPDADEP